MDETGSGRQASETKDDSQLLTERNEDVDERSVEVRVNDVPIDLAVGPEAEAEVASEVAVDEPVLEAGPEANVVPDEPQVEAEAVSDDAAAEPDPLEAENLELQNAIFESCSVRPLTPLGKCAGVPPVMTVHKTAAGVFEGRDFPHEAYSYLEPLLAHVEVYSFAKYHLLSGLQELALQRTIVTLRKLDCSLELAEQELTKAIEFVYDNIPADRGNEEPMRKLFSQFAAANYTSLLHDSFETLITRGGDFALGSGTKIVASPPCAWGAAE